MKISDEIAQHNANHGKRTDDRNKLNTFNVGDVIQKFYACSSDPFQILMKLNYDIYIIDLPIDFGVSSTFNIYYLVDYKCFINIIPLVDEFSHESIFESPFLSPLSDILSYTICQVDKFLNDKIITTQVGGIQKYLICWTEKIPILMIYG